MKKILIAFLFVLVLVPLSVSAHIEESSNTGNTGFMMMQQVENQALGSTLHEEMECLMEKMMSGNLSQEETNRMVDLMSQYPGPGSMMMGRIMGMETHESGFNSLNNNSMMGYGLGWLGGGIFMILFWVLVIAGIVALVRYTMDGQKQGSSKKALDILKERYAKGEIDKDEFEKKKKEM